MDFNDIIIKVDKSNCGKVIVSPEKLDAGWHHQIRIKLMYGDIVKKDLPLWNDSHTAIGQSKTVDLNDHKDLCSGSAIVTVPTVPTTVVPPTIPSACTTNVNFTVNLFPGDSGPMVAAMQTLLKCLNYFPQDITANGYFGPTTMGSVQKLQKDNNISQTGNAGPLTRAVLNKYFK